MTYWYKTNAQEIINAPEVQPICGCPRWKQVYNGLRTEQNFPVLRAQNKTRLMFYEIKTKYGHEDGDGIIRIYRKVYLTECNMFTEAETLAYQRAREDKKCHSIDVTDIRRSSIYEVANPDAYQKDGENRSWLVMLKATYMVDEKKKVRKYKVLFWSDEIVNAKSDLVMNYIRQVDENDGTFEVSDIKECPICEVL